MGAAVERIGPVLGDSLSGTDRGLCGGEGWDGTADPYPWADERADRGQGPRDHENWSKELLARTPLMADGWAAR